MRPGVAALAGIADPEAFWQLCRDELSGVDVAADGWDIRARWFGVVVCATALEEQRNGEWRYLEFLQVTSLITADIFTREIPGGTRARHRSRPVDLPETDTDHSDQTVPVLFAPLFLEGRRAGGRADLLS